MSTNQGTNAITRLLNGDEDEDRRSRINAAVRYAAKHSSGEKLRSLAKEIGAVLQEHAPLQASESRKPTTPA